MLSKEGNQKAAEAIEKTLNDLPKTAVIENEKAVDDARIAYEILTTAQKELVDEKALTKLTEAEKQIADAKAKETGKTDTENEVTSSQGNPSSSTSVMTETDAKAYNKAVKNAKALKVKKVKAKAKSKRKAKITWKANKKASGYQIQYSTNRKFKKGVKTITIKGSSKKSATIKKLKTGRTYYIRIRPYIGINIPKRNDEIVFGRWSKVARVKAKN